MELRRILMGLYLLAFPAMMWGQTPVVPGTACLLYTSPSPRD